MRTAEAIMQESITDSKAYSIDPFEVFEKMKVAGHLAINRARREAIEECANAAILNYKGNGHPTITVDKESILSLIKELK